MLVLTGCSVWTSVRPLCRLSLSRHCGLFWQDSSFHQLLVLAAPPGGRSRLTVQFEGVIAVHFRILQRRNLFALKDTSKRVRQEVFCKDALRTLQLNFQQLLFSLFPFHILKFSRACNVYSQTFYSTVAKDVQLNTQTPFIFTPKKDNICL